MIIKRGYHRLKTSEGRVVEGPLVVELAEDDSFLSYHILEKEEEATEWVGGEYKSLTPNPSPRRGELIPVRDEECRK